MFIGTISGNLGKDAEVKDKEGRQFITFSVAHTDHSKKEGENTMWIHCASNQVKLAEYLKKGKSVVVNGAITVTTYEGKPQVSCSVTAIELVGKKEG